MRRTRSILAHVAPLVAYCALVYAVSALPSPAAPEYPFQWGDKINHALAYAMMCLLATRAGRAFGDRPLRARIVPAIVFCALYGATDELHQYFVPGRSCDALDWIADVVGASVSASIIPLAARWRPVAHLVGEPAPATGGRTA